MALITPHASKSAQITVNTDCDMHIKVSDQISGNTEGSTQALKFHVMPVLALMVHDFDLCCLANLFHGNWSDFLIWCACLVVAAAQVVFIGVFCCYYSSENVVTASFRA